MVIANVLDANQSLYIKETLSKHPLWLEFKNGTLLESNYNNNMPLAGH
jgi:hypothetical protein